MDIPRAAAPMAADVRPLQRVCFPPDSEIIPAPPHLLLARPRPAPGPGQPAPHRHTRSTRITVAPVPVRAPPPRRDVATRQQPVESGAPRPRQVLSFIRRGASPVRLVAQGGRRQ